MRVESVTYYVSNDGTKHLSERACMEHEALCMRVAAALLPLGPQRRLESNQCIQHTQRAFNQARSGILKLLREKHDWPVLNNPDNEIHPMCGIGRMLDGESGPVAMGWHRLGSINPDSFREYNQPFFALNESEFEGTVVA